MANTINHASKYARELIETYIDNSYIAPFVTTNVQWLDAKSFHFTNLKTAGYKNHSLNGGWNRFYNLMKRDHGKPIDRE